jgi:ribosome-interacting GTPase 1
MMIMYFIITLLALPVLIKLFTDKGIKKLKLLPKSVITAEMVIEQMNKRKIRSAKVEIAYAYTKNEFHDKFKARELSRQQIVAIRKYLSQSVEQYEHKKFTNDIHAIYVMLNARDISRRNLEIIQKIIA